LGEEAAKLNIAVDEFIDHINTLNELKIDQENMSDALKDL
jgi:hypothetical protein